MCPSTFARRPDFYLLRLVCTSVNMSWEIFFMAKNCSRRRTRQTRGTLGQALASVPEHSRIPPTHFLIANPELKLHLSPIRISELRFPNRKYFAVFRAGPRHSFASSLAAAFLIETPRLKFPATPTKQSSDADSNRDKNDGFSSSSRLAPSSATLTLRAPQSNLPASCFVRATPGEYSL